MHQVARGGWAQVAGHRGAQAARLAYAEMLAGRADACLGLMLSMGD